MSARLAVPENVKNGLMLLVVFVCWSVSQSAERHVMVSGMSSGDGSLERPWSFPYALAGAGSE